MCSVGIYYNVYRFKNYETIRNGQRDETVRHAEKYARQRNGAKYSESENKIDNFTKELND